MSTVKRHRPVFFGACFAIAQLNDGIGRVLGLDVLADSEANQTRGRLQDGQLFSFLGGVCKQ